MPIFVLPLWVWLNAMVLVAAGAYVLGKISGETSDRAARPA